MFNIYDVNYVVHKIYECLGIRRINTALMLINSVGGYHSLQNNFIFKHIMRDY